VKFLFGKINEKGSWHVHHIVVVVLFKGESGDFSNFQTD
jgi:hypothetical protein